MNGDYDQDPTEAPEPNMNFPAESPVASALTRIHRKVVHLRDILEHETFQKLLDWEGDETRERFKILVLSLASTVEKALDMIYSHFEDTYDRQAILIEDGPEREELESLFKNSDFKPATKPPIIVERGDL